MSVGAPAAIGYAAAVSRIDQIQSQVTGLQTAFSPSASASGGAGLTTGAAGASTAVGGAASSATIADSLGTGASSGSSGTFASALSGAMTGVAGSTALSTLSTGATTALPAGASKLLTSDQQQFASRLATQTGLDPGVVSAWLLAEESGGAAQSRQTQGNNDWLNIGYTDSGTFGSSDSVWSDPTTAADATAGWLKGQDTIPGYGTASSGIQAIVGTAGRPPADQIAALQGSGWASSGYPSLTSLYSQVTGSVA